MPSPRPSITYLPSLKKAQKNKTEAKIAQAKVDAKTAKATAANPKTVGSNVKVVPPMTAAERGNRNAAEEARTRSYAVRPRAVRALAESNVVKGPTVSVRSNAGISGKGGTSVGKVFKPMGGAGLGGLFGIKNK